MLSATRRFVVSFAGSIKAGTETVSSFFWGSVIDANSRARTSHRTLFSVRGEPCMRHAPMGVVVCFVL